MRMHTKTHTKKHELWINSIESTRLEQFEQVNCCCRCCCYYSDHTISSDTFVHIVVWIYHSKIGVQLHGYLPIFILLLSFSTQINSIDVWPMHTCHKLLMNRHTDTRTLQYSKIIAVFYYNFLFCRCSLHILFCRIFWNNKWIKFSCMPLSDATSSLTFRWDDSHLRFVRL